MAENQGMCLYYENNERNEKCFFCKSPGNPKPDEWKDKDRSTTFKTLCRYADARGWQERCDCFIVPESTAINGQTAQDSLAFVSGQGRTESEADNGQPRRRARERLTYLSRMNADGTLKNSEPRNAQAQARTAAEQEGNGSPLVKAVLKTGAKTAVDIGKAIINPVGAGADFAADIAKQIIDEL